MQKVQQRSCRHFARKSFCVLYHTNKKRHQELWMSWGCQASQRPGGEKQGPWLHTSLSLRGASASPEHCAARILQNGTCKLCQTGTQPLQAGRTRHWCVFHFVMIFDNISNLGLTYNVVEKGSFYSSVPRFLSMILERADFSFLWRQRTSIICQIPLVLSYIG